MPWSVQPIADNCGSLLDFGPYAPAINRAGVVAFTATLRSGGTGLFTVRGQSLSMVARSGDAFGEICSHPDINDRGDLCFYAALLKGGIGAFRLRDGELTQVSSPADHALVGPLGPTINEAGVVALRAESRSGRRGVWLGEPPRLIADDSRQIAALQGLPVVTDSGVVVFRADLRGGGQAILAGRGGSLTTLVDTDGALASLGNFPSVNAGETVAFAATLRAGGGGVFVCRDGEITKLNTGEFESFRGALIDDWGRVVFFATPPGGTVGVYIGGERVLGLGDPLFGSTIVDFALNPVSMSGEGQIAVRLSLEDGFRCQALRVDIQAGKVPGLDS